MQQATVFNATFEEAVAAFEKQKKVKYNFKVDLSEYYQHDMPTLHLVKDDGIYLMAAAKMEKIPDDKSHICFAEGFEDTAPNIWEKCRSAVGGDDFVEVVRFTPELRQDIEKGANIEIILTEKTMRVNTVIKKDNGKSNAKVKK